MKMEIDSFHSVVARITINQFLNYDQKANLKTKWN